MSLISASADPFEYLYPRKNLPFMYDKGMKYFSKYWIVASLLALLFLFVNEPSQAQGQVKDKLVNLYLWNDYIDPKVLDDFTKETGIKVIYDSYENTERVETKMLSGKSGYDVVLTSAPVLHRLISSGAFMPLDRAKLPNHKNLRSDILDRMKLIDPDNIQAVPYLWGTIGLGVNVTAIKKRLGNDFPQSWDLLLDPKLSSKLKDCAIHLMDSPDELYPNILRALKLDPNSRKIDDLQKVSDALFRVRSNVTKFDGADSINGLASGSICLGIGPSSDIAIARQRTQMAGGNLEVTYILPREGASIWVDSFSIPRDAPNSDNAHAFINYLLRPDVAAANSNLLNLSHAVANAERWTKPENVKNQHLFPNAEMMQKLFLTTPWDERTGRLVARQWQRVKTGK
jgi:putrescine transport system substrate-binding protein